MALTSATWYNNPMSLINFFIHQIISQCKERHTNICPEFDKYGKCEKGKNCSYPHKTCLLTQHNRVRLPRALNSYEPSKFGNKTVDISVRDDSKKRYYDESCSGQNFEDKRCNINKQIRAMTMVYRAMEGPDVEIITDEEINSQPITEEVRPRRPPIGPLPSYIPINWYYLIFSHWRLEFFY